MTHLVDSERKTLAWNKFDLQRLADKLNGAVLKGRREPSDRAKVSFAPSGLGYGAGVCARRWMYDLHGGYMRDDDTDAVSISMMESGADRHERIQKALLESGLAVEIEREVSSIGKEGLPPIRGYIDAVLDWNGEIIPCEIKTTSQESYVSKKSKNKPAGYNLLQILIYMKALAADKGLLLYENRNTLRILPMPVTWTTENLNLIEDVFNWLTDIYEEYKKGTRPEDIKRPARVETSALCRSCPFYSHCWNSKDGDIVKPKLRVPA